MLGFLFYQLIDLGPEMEATFISDILRYHFWFSVYLGSKYANNANRTHLLNLFYKLLTLKHSKGLYLYS
jgi:hypothetical protein